MLLEEARQFFSTMKKGTYRKIAYKSDVPVKAQYKNSVKIIKVSSATGRFGIYYGNVASVKDKDNAEGYVPKANTNKEWVIPNILEYNANTKKHYLNVYTTPNKTKSVYLVTENGRCRMVKSLYQVKPYVIESYFKKDYSGKIEMYKVNLDNVYFIK